jgi:hypothetical protein
MRLDHISYVASHEQISDVVNRIGSQIKTAFVDGGIHPKFGTRNFTAPLMNGQYIEVVCPLDHPATETNPFGQAVKKRASIGGGWLFLVLATSDISIEEKKKGRKSVNGLRRKPDGEFLKWKQIGVLDSMENPEIPYIIEWASSNHPSQDGIPKAKVIEIELNTINEQMSEYYAIEQSRIEHIPSLKLNKGTEPSGIQSITFLLGDETIEIV